MFGNGYLREYAFFYGTLLQKVYSLEHERGIKRNGETTTAPWYIILGHENCLGPEKCSLASVLPKEFVN
jgi:hypothetical protein